MDVKQKYTADVDPKQITITYDFIDNMERDPKVMVEWEDIIYVKVIVALDMSLPKTENIYIWNYFLN